MSSAEYTQPTHQKSACLPKENILVNMDLDTPPAHGATSPAATNPGTITLHQNIKRLKLDVAQHVPIHGRPGANGEFLKIAGKMI